MIQFTVSGNRRPLLPDGNVCLTRNLLTGVLGISDRRISVYPTQESESLNLKTKNDSNHFAGKLKLPCCRVQ